MNFEHNKIVNCKLLAKQLEENLLLEANKLKEKNITPCFATILVGNNPASLLYVNNKNKKAKVLGIENKMHVLSENISEIELVNIINQLNNDHNIHGILVQLPLPKHINSQLIINNISPLKDIDGLHSFNIGKFLTNDENSFVPCTPLGCLHIIKHLETNLKGKNAVVIGRSNLVGLPIFHLLLNNDATVTITHSKTNNLKEICKSADIIVSAVGKPLFINNSYIKRDSIVIDVGISRIKVEEKVKIVGDVDTENVLDKVKYITSVPGGVGLLTIMFLMSNVIKATKISNRITI